MYLSKTIESFKSAAHRVDSYDESSDVNAFGVARDYLREEPTSSDSFLRGLISNYNFQTHGYVTYNELCHLLPGLDQNVDVILASPVQKSMEYQPGQGESWRGSTHETIAVTVLSQSVPAIMSDCLLTRVGFVATNDVLGGEHTVTVFEARGFVSGLDYTSNISYMIERVKRELLQDISQQNQITYNVEVHVDMLNESHFKISLNGGPFIYYAQPSFCDGLYAPVVCSDPQYIANMAHDVDNMLRAISQEAYQQLSL
jgi:hypothetical protein